MPDMPTREELQQQLADLDRQISAELGKTKLPELRSEHRQFPGATWILAALCFGWYALGASVPVAGEYHAMTAQWVMYAGILLAVIAALRTLLWLTKRNPKGDAQYVESTGRVRELQAMRRDLMKQMKDLDS